MMTSYQQSCMDLQTEQASFVISLLHDIIPIPLVEAVLTLASSGALQITQYSGLKFLRHLTTKNRICGCKHTHETMVSMR